MKRILTLTLGAAIVFAAGTSSAKEPAKGKNTDVAQCIAASEQVQQAMRQGKLQEAREAVPACMDPKCPAMLRTDCDEYSKKVEAAMPSIRLRVTSKAGSDLPSATVTIDDKPTPLDGRPLELDPGPHKVKASADGYEAAEQELVVQESVKAREVQLQLAPLQAAQPALPPPTTPTKSKKPATGTWIATGALGGLAVAGLAVFAGMGLAANSRYSELERECGGRCAPADVDGLRTRYLVADVGLVVGVVSAVAAGAVLVFGPRKTEAAPSAPAAGTPTAATAAQRGWKLLRPAELAVR